MNVNLNPEILGAILTSVLPEDIVVSEQTYNDWLKHHCTVAAELDFLNEISGAWNRILTAKTHEEFLEARGVYKGLVVALRVIRQITNANETTPATKAEAVKAADETMKDLLDAY